MTLPAGVDFIELQGVPASASSSVLKYQSLGTACAMASDSSSCLNMFANVPSPYVSGACWCPCGETCGEEVNLVETRGDAVVVASTVGPVGLALAPIDDAAKAMLVTEFDGYDVPCAGGGAAPTGGGWLVMGFTSTCNSSTLHVVKVDSDGAATEERSEVIFQGSGQCAY
jgi:hypothetical protein